MRTYESIIVFHPETTDEVRRDVHEKVQALVEKSGGEIQAKDDWGKRKLGYTVDKQRFGVMNRVQLKAGSKVVSELDQVFRHTESVIKYMTVAVNERQLKAAKSAEAQVPAHLDNLDNSRRRK